MSEQEQSPKGTQSYEGRRDSQIMDGKMTLDEQNQINKAWNKATLALFDKMSDKQWRGKKVR